MPVRCFAEVPPTRSKTTGEVALALNESVLLLNRGNHFEAIPLPFKPPWPLSSALQLRISTGTATKMFF
jgi:hypothetical protein